MKTFASRTQKVKMKDVHKKACSAQRISETRHLMPERENMHGLDVKSDTYTHSFQNALYAAPQSKYFGYGNWFVKERILFTLVS